MVKSKDVHDPDAVTAHIEKLDPEIGVVVETIRQIILGVDPLISERIKWNNPSFFYSGEMLPFDPKTYKREIAVFNLFKGRIMLVFPGGAKVNDDSGLLTGDYPDGRRIATFDDLDDVASKKEALLSVIKTWLTLVNE
ncbi:MAG: DUF1801 domain-containing protein [Bacteroidota bacterium]